MRSTQRCSESFSWLEKARRMRSFTGSVEAGCGVGFRILGFGFGFRFDFARVLGFGLGGLGGLFFLRGLVAIAGGSTVKFIEKLFVEAEGLLPGFQLVASELSFFFVGSKIKQEINVGHEQSLRREKRQVKRGEEHGAWESLGSGSVSE